MGATRTETDSLGAVEVPAERYWGAQTERSRRNFPIGDGRMPIELVRALGTLKIAAAEVNGELGLLDGARRDAIVAAAGEVERGALDDEFPLVVWQTGSGTQTNMNVNEVVAGRANEILSGARGGKHPVHPNDHVNLGQSSNDAFPTATSIAAVRMLVERTLPAVGALRATLDEKSRAHAGVVKIGRTHLMDATPLTLGQEISGWVAQLDLGIEALERSLARLGELAAGGTAVGTGLGTHPAFAVRVAARIAERTSLPFVTSRNKFAALGGHDALVLSHGALRQLATACAKIAGDVRLLSSGPRAGLGEITIPDNEPGSSIMPGKVNPTQCEALLMVTARVLGNDVTIGHAASQGILELNVMRPVLGHAFLESARLLGDACASFEERCARGIEPNLPVLDGHLRRSLMLVTALVPRLGYDAAARIAKHAHAEGTTLKESAITLGLVSADEFDALVVPAEMTRPSR